MRTAQGLDGDRGTCVYLRRCDHALCVEAIDHLTEVAGRAGHDELVTDLTALNIMLGSSLDSLTDSIDFATLMDAVESYLNSQPATGDKRAALDRLYGRLWTCWVRADEPILSG